MNLPLNSNRMTHHILENTHKSVQALKNKLDELRELNILLAKHLDPEMAKHIQIVKFEKNCLFVLAANGNWATQLRFRIPDLMQQLQQYPALSRLGGIISKTRPIPSQPKAPTVNRKKITLTAESAQRIMETAKTIKDKKLRAILEKIAGYTK